MADEIDTQDDDVLELTDELEDEPEGEAHEPADNDDGEGDDFAIELEGEEAVEEDTPLVRKLRDTVRDTQRELAEYRKASAPAKIEVGKEPDLWDDFEGDVEKYNAARDAWTDRKHKAAQQDNAIQEQAEVRNREMQRLHTNYRTKAAQLPVKDFEAAEQTVIATLPEITQSAIIAYAEDPAKVVYALAKHPSKLTALAEETDPIRAVLAIRDMERNLKVVTRKRPPAPEAETIVRGSTNISPNSKAMEKLSTNARATGDRTALIAAKAKQRQAA